MLTATATAISGVECLEACCQPVVGKSRRRFLKMPGRSLRVQRSPLRGSAKQRPCVFKAGQVWKRLAKLKSAPVVAIFCRPSHLCYNPYQLDERRNHKGFFGLHEKCNKGQVDSPIASKQPWPRDHRRPNSVERKQKGYQTPCAPGHRASPL